ncbi:MAG: histidinol-phosphatase [Gemmatimonadetes bacterium]|nr:histidinol-phosphatase [Gemmatimonadota bacterium]
MTDHRIVGSPSVTVDGLLAVAIELAYQAGAVTLSHFGKVHSADAKADGSPVTVADREAEALLREGIRARFPDHGILGEEFGEEAGTAPIRWVLDPIDGTRSFMRGVPIYAVLIGVEVEGKPVVGVAHLPALAETVAAGQGIGCRWIGGSGGASRSARVSDTTELGDALTLTTDPQSVLASPIAGGWKELCARVGVVRGWGDAYGHVLVATGRAEIMVDPVLSPWDAAALIPILSEAGGRFTDLGGEESIHGGSGVSTNGHLHHRVLGLLRGA